jgi:hypothetical protein
MRVFFGSSHGGNVIPAHSCTVSLFEFLQNAHYFSVG